ncbi:MAG: serine hydrolase, partial [Bacteroidales bacterium]|nr:serine hydrolase [Bacteroidales bacterium]
YKEVKKSKLLTTKDYVYSGLSFLLYPEIIKNLTGSDYENYLKQNFYYPLGAYTLTYNPLKMFDKSRIVPTENDTFFRNQQICGTVHDEAAAVLGGVSGNAGLFGTTLDLAKLMQMYLNMGQYGGIQFISDTTLGEFTRYQYPENENRRGLGFDKPMLKDKENGHTAIDASDKSFGHSGYTGTFVWADPENGILFVFMSNRVYPTRNNSKIYEFNIRPAIQQVLYDAVKKKEIRN